MKCTFQNLNLNNDRSLKYLFAILLLSNICYSKVTKNESLFNDISECQHSRIFPSSTLGSCGSNGSFDFVEMKSFFCENYLSSSKKFTIRAELKFPFDDSFYTAAQDEEVIFTFQLSKNPEIIVTFYHDIQCNFPYQLTNSKNS